MSDDKIEEIMARHSRRSKIDQYGCYRLDGFTYVGSLAQYQQDMDTLLAEDARHRAEIERLRAALKGIDALYPDVPDALGANDLRVIVAQMGDLAVKALEGEA